MRFEEVPPAGFTPSQRKQTTKESGSPVGEEAFEGQTAATRFSFQRGAEAGLAVPERQSRRFEHQGDGQKPLSGQEHQ